MSVQYTYTHIQKAKAPEENIDIKTIMLWKNKELENKEENCQKNKL